MFAGPDQPKSDEPEKEEAITVSGHTRNRKKKTEGTPDDSGLRFGPDVPVQEIEMP